MVSVILRSYPYIKICEICEICVTLSICEIRVTK